MRKTATVLTKSTKLAKATIAKRAGLVKAPRYGVVRISLDGTRMTAYKTVREASAKTKTPCYCIYAAVNNHAKTGDGFIWKKFN